MPFSLGVPARVARCGVLCVVGVIASGWLPAPATADVPSDPLPQSTGTRRWVDPNGSDSAPGTAAAPLRTIVRAFSLAAPGQRVTLRTGTYPDRVISAPRGGTSIWSSNNIEFSGLEIFGYWGAGAAHQIGHGRSPLRNRIHPTGGSWPLHDHGIYCEYARRHHRVTRQQRRRASRATPSPHSFRDRASRCRTTCSGTQRALPRRGLVLGLRHDAEHDRSAPARTPVPSSTARPLRPRPAGCGRVARRPRRR
jgi:hypothetical protein